MFAGEFVCLSPFVREGTYSMDDATRNELEAAAFRRLVAHFQERTDVQNIDLMILSGFCRNCMANWYEDAARSRGIDLDREAARQAIYGMAYGEWKAKYQAQATDEQMAKLAKVHKH